MRSAESPTALVFVPGMGRQGVCDVAGLAATGWQLAGRQGRRGPRGVGAGRLS